MSYLLSAVLRTVKGEKAREQGALPAVVYGSGSEPQSLALAYRDFEKLYKEAGEASLIDLTVDGKETGKVLVQEVQYDPISDRMMHVDLRKIDMSKPITAYVELKFVGVSPAVKDLGGTLVHNLNEVEVKCLPKDLVARLEVNVDSLKTFEDNIKIKDLVLPAGVAILGHNENDVVATATPALTEEQIKAMEEASKTADITKIEVAGKKKEEEEGAEEGEEGAAGAKKEEKKDEKPAK